jgi:hypothetical protein
MSGIMSKSAFITKASGRDDLARRLASESLEKAQHGGNWIVGAALLIALLWMGAVIAGGVGYVGTATLLAQPPLILAAGAMGALVPALLIIVSGFMARANRRAAAAQTVLLDAAGRLLAPAREAGTEGLAFAEQMKQAASEIDEAITKSLSTMRTMATEIGGERHRLESVSYATTDNARDLAQRLAAERQALETLARDLRAQIQSMNEAIPRQAQLMIASAKQAGEEVAAADAALEARLEHVTKVGDTLSRRLIELDALGEDAAGRAEQLTAAVSRIESQLDKSRRTLEAAIRASETATEVTTHTGDALAAAANAALGQVRRVQSEIEAATRTASDEAVRSLARLREAGEQAAIAVRNAHLTARQENEALAARLEPPRPLPNTRHTPQPEGVPPPISAFIAPPPPVVHVERATASPLTITQKPSRDVDDELFEAALDAFGADAPTLELGAALDPNDRDPLLLRRRLDDAPPPVVTPAETTAPRDLAWRDIIADMGKEDIAAVPDNDREAIAEQLLGSLRHAHIDLADVFKPRAKAKIAEAAKKGYRVRRAAVLEHAGKQVDQVIKHLRGNAKVTEIARQFLALEVQDALEALEQTSKTSRNASPRLAAYLLLDAAL